MTDFAKTDDGLVARLQFLAEMVRIGRPASKLTRSFETVQRLLKDVHFSARAQPLEADAVRAVI